MTFFMTPDGGPFFQIRNYFMFHLLYRLSTSVTLESEHTGALLVTCRKNRNIFMCLLNILMQMPSCCLLFYLQSLAAPQEAVPSGYQVLATKTYFTTSTYYTTLIEQSRTITRTRTKVKSSIVTETYNGGNFEEHYGSNNKDVFQSTTLVDGKNQEKFLSLGIYFGKLQTSAV